MSDNPSNQEEGSPQEQPDPITQSRHQLGDGNQQSPREQQEPAQGSSQSQAPMSPPPEYTSQEPEVETPPLFQAQITPQTVSEAIDYLDKIPHRTWGSEDQKAHVVVLCNAWREKNPRVDSWLAHNILMMDEEAAFKVIVAGGQMTGAYRFCAYVRMQNWAFWSDEQKRLVMELGDLNPPRDPEVPILNWFTEPRADHQFFDVTDEMARAFLDQDTVETQNLFEAFEASFDWTKEAMHWMAANILHMNSEPLAKDDWAIKKAKKPAKRRMRNWMKLHFTWREEFMTLAIIPFTRKAVKWDPNQKQRLDCLQDPPSANPHLESTMDQIMAHGYLSQDSTCTFSEEQTEYLFNIWMVNNPKYRLWAHHFIVPGHIKITLNRMRNWLIMDAGWKEHFIHRVWPKRF